ncbi:hypothetical protein PCE1_000266 [Barthelona sp. PCE]
MFTNKEYLTVSNVEFDDVMVDSTSLKDFCTFKIKDEFCGKTIGENAILLSGEDAKVGFDLANEKIIVYKHEDMYPPVIKANYDSGNLNLTLELDIESILAPYAAKIQCSTIDSESSETILHKPESVLGGWINGVTYVIEDSSPSSILYINGVNVGELEVPYLIYAATCGRSLILVSDNSVTFLLIDTENPKIEKQFMVEMEVMFLRIAPSPYSLDDFYIQTKLMFESSYIAAVEWEHPRLRKWNALYNGIPELEINHLDFGFVGKDMVIIDNSFVMIRQRAEKDYLALCMYSHMIDELQVKVDTPHGLCGDKLCSISYNPESDTFISRTYLFETKKMTKREFQLGEFLKNAKIFYFEKQ